MKIKVTVSGKVIRAQRQVIEIDTDKIGVAWTSLANVKVEVEGKEANEFSLAVSYKGHVTLEKRDRIPGVAYPKGE